MRKTFLVLVTVSAVVLSCGLAFQDDAAPAEQPSVPAEKPGAEQPSGNGSSFGDINFTSYAGIAAAITMLIGFFKKLWVKWVKGKELYLAYGLAVAIGVTAKALGAFGGASTGSESWVNHIIALIGAGAGAGLIHDKIINPLKEKPEPK